MGKRNCIAKEAYTQWVKEVLLPFPSEPYMSIKPSKLIVVPIFKVDKLKETIKVLEKENVDLRSNLGNITLEKENFKLNLNQKRERELKPDNEVQTEL